MGDFNQSVVLEAIRRSGDGLSRTEIVAATGLSAQTITNITRRLLDHGFIHEAGRTITGPGKPRVTLRLVPDSRFSVGVHLDPALMTFVLLDLSGAVVRRMSVRTPPGRCSADHRDHGGDHRRTDRRLRRGSLAHRRGRSRRPRTSRRG